MLRKRVLSVLSIILIISSVLTGCGKKDSVETNQKVSDVVVNSKAETTMAVSTETTSEITSSAATKITTATAKGTFTTKTVTMTSVTSSAVSNETETSATSKKPLNQIFFDDAVFVGDSVTLGLRNYVTSERSKGNSCLGKAQFLVAGSMGYTNANLAADDDEAIHPKYQGKEVTIEDGVKKIGAKKVFIMLGMNDFCAFSFESGMTNARKCVTRITDKNPGVKIYIQSVTPTIYNKGKFNNKNIDAFNNGLKELCRKNGWTYVDVASAMKDSNGLLKKSYCSDPEGKGIHMTYTGCKEWVNYLNKTFA